MSTYADELAAMQDLLTADVISSEEFAEMRAEARMRYGIPDYIDDATAARATSGQGSNRGGGAAQAQAWGSGQTQGWTQEQGQARGWSAGSQDFAQGGADDKFAQAAREAGEKVGEAAYVVGTTMASALGAAFEGLKEGAKAHQEDFGRYKETVDQHAERVKQQVATSEKSHVAAGVLGILVGSLGVHKFYLGRKREGLIMLGVTVFGALIGLGPLAMGLLGMAEGIKYLVLDQADFERQYVYGDKRWF